MLLSVFNTCINYLALFSIFIIGASSSDINCLLQSSSGVLSEQSPDEFFCPWYRNLIRHVHVQEDPSGKNNCTKSSAYRKYRNCLSDKDCSQDSYCCFSICNGITRCYNPYLNIFADTISSLRLPPSCTFPDTMKHGNTTECPHDKYSTKPFFLTSKIQDTNGSITSTNEKEISITQAPFTSVKLTTEGSTNMENPVTVTPSELNPNTYTQTLNSISFETDSRYEFISSTVPPTTSEQSTTNTINVTTRKSTTASSPFAVNSVTKHYTKLVRNNESAINDDYDQEEISTIPPKTQPANSNRTTVKSSTGDTLSNKNTPKEKPTKIKTASPKVRKKNPVASTTRKTTTTRKPTTTTQAVTISIMPINEFNPELITNAPGKDTNASNPNVEPGSIKNPLEDGVDHYDEVGLSPKQTDIEGFVKEESV